ncbi:FAD binding domain-containing protein [bacterium]|nr:FAD binding domain-containing protein [bacterium]
MTHKSEWLAPDTINDVIQLLRDDPLNTRLLAGGTDLQLELRQHGNVNTTRLLSLHRVRDLSGITQLEDAWIRIGATTRICDLLESQLVQQKLPLLAKAAALIGCAQTRNLATIGGNIVNAAACADTVPPLLVYNAELLLQSHLGERRLPLAGFIERPYTTAIGRDELLTAIIVPPGEWRHPMTAFRKLGRRKALNITRISVAALLDLDKSGVIRAARLSGGSVMPTPHRITPAEVILTDSKATPALMSRAAAAAAKYVFGLQPERWSTTYKRPVFENMVRDTLLSIMATCHEESR